MFEGRCHVRCLRGVSESEEVMSLTDTEVDSDESVKAKEFFQSLSMPEKF